ncbi:hypothetical protein EW145_g5973 [Phellinidium pouzarii]|uniref:Rad21/Rec8-like protein N-terminal domain-containing protein n=1 Tax=Phellinidium pouzarii TaxID=167371 RepID=A0A4S4KYP6_9AGAM|nr:hypothetical protein EW145_g5973 [Phellinidium pouzarii]
MTDYTPYESHETLPEACLKSIDSSMASVSYPSTSVSEFPEYLSVPVDDAAVSTVSLDSAESSLAPTPPSDQSVSAVKIEKELSEQELRRLFEDEEIERFLGLFADYVSEVTIPEHNVERTSQSAMFSSVNIAEEGEIEESSSSGNPEDEWLAISSALVPPLSLISPSASDAQCISEHIAYKYLRPSLPPARPRPERFTMGRLRLTVQRLYLVIHPAYSTYFSRIIALATWKNKNRIILDAVVSKLLPYPTLAELRERRYAAARSEELGEQIQLRLGATSSSGLMEAWRLFRIFSKPNRKVKQKQGKHEDKSRSKNKDKSEDEDKDKDEEKEKTTTESASNVLKTPNNDDEATVLDNPNESKEERDFKRALLNTLNDIADVHERVKKSVISSKRSAIINLYTLRSIFLWRTPHTSAGYAALLVFLIVFTIFLPTKYIVKLAFFIMGFLYWHVIPIIASLPPLDQSRLPPLFENAMTDAEYAMDLISQRVARGEDIRPRPRKTAKRSNKTTRKSKGKPVTKLARDELTSETEFFMRSEGESATSESVDGKAKSSGRPGEVDWRKWGDRAASVKSWSERAANMKSWAAQGKRLVENSEYSKQGAEEDPPQTALADEAESSGEIYAFLAHHKTSPGMLTLARTKLLFTPITSTHPKICITLNDVRGVKKIGFGAVPGLSVKWQRSSESHSEIGTDNTEGCEVIEEKFVLAATLGSKSSFKKLPRRSIQAADIPQLCDLISHPSEPLALRLSSNLMVGVARVYKSAHEIFMTDVSNCFVLLKKAIQDIHALGALPEAQLQMGQPTARPDTLTLTADPTIAVAFELDAFDANWNDFSNFVSQRQKGSNNDDDGDDEFTLNNKSKSKSKSKLSLVLSERGRTGMHTLDEHHEHILSTSFDANGSFIAGIDPSSQIEPGMFYGSYGFDDDNIFGPGDQLDLGINDIGDDLARELGEGWGIEVGSIGASGHFHVEEQPDFQMGTDLGMGLDDGFDNHNVFGFPVVSEDGKSRTPRGRKRPFADSDKENMPPVSPRDLLAVPQSVLNSPGRMNVLENALGQDNGQTEVPELIKLQNTEGAHTRKAKKVRLLLDARTELTDEELKAARENYVEGQRAIRLEIDRKKLEREGVKVLEDMIWGIPKGLTAPALTKFWTEIYKIQVESRSGAIHLDDRDEPRRKRQKSAHNDSLVAIHDNDGNAFNPVNDNYAPMGTGGDYDFSVMQNDYDAPVNFDDPSRIRSSEEPEHGRNAISRASNALGFDAEMLNPSSGTQRSALFPWDNAAGTSSSAGAGFAPLGDKGSDHLSLDNTDVRIARSRSRSGSRRGSFSIVPSQTGSLIGLNIGLSPGHGSGNDFRFEVTNEGVIGQDTQDTENNIITIERNSYNFLEYCKMQVQTLPDIQSTLEFTDVVPSATSSRKVAAAAFHHCLETSERPMPIVLLFYLPSTQY